MESKIFVVIPIRYKSSRFPGKALVDIAGKPLIQRVYEQAMKSSAFVIMVATDDQRILECVRSFGGNAVLTDPTHICGTERVVEVVNNILSPLNSDIVINVQGDQVVFPGRVIDSLAQILKIHSDILVATPFKQIGDVDEIGDPNYVKVVFDTNGNALYFSRSDIPYCRSKKRLPVYFKHVGIYAYRPFFLKKYASLTSQYLENTECLEQLRILENGYKIRMVYMWGNHIDVNVPEDAEKARKYLTFQGKGSTIRDKCGILP